VHRLKTPHSGRSVIELSLVENDSTALGDALSDACSGATRARIAVAFAKGSGLAAAPSLERLAASGGEVQLLAGVDFQLTDLDAVSRFDRPPSVAKVYLHPFGEERVVFHPKVYLLESDEIATAIVGSSNLTAGGLSGNVEANVMIRAAPDHAAIVRVREFHQKLWHSAFAYPVTKEFRETYGRLQSRRHAVELSLRRESDFARAHRELRLAVAETVTSYSLRQGGSSWLLITSPENYIRNIDGKVWGDEKRGRIGRVRPGDLIFFYITSPLMAVGGVGMVTTEPYEDHTPYWPDRTYPHRFQFALLVKPPTPIPLRPMISQMDLFGRREDPTWGQKLQRSMVPLSTRDGHLLREGLVSAAGAAA
jgi:HKD family nuclease